MRIARPRGSRGAPNPVAPCTETVAAEQASRERENWWAMVSYCSCAGFTIISTTYVSEIKHTYVVSAAWSAFLLKHVVTMSVSSETIMIV